MLVRKIKDVEHAIYNDEKEFNQYCPSEDLTRNWRDGTEGSWVMTDDGKVCRGAFVITMLGQQLVPLSVGTIL